MFTVRVGRKGAAIVPDGRLWARDENLGYGSADPADPEVTRHVMTILRASEH